MKKLMFLFMLLLLACGKTTEKTEKKVSQIKESVKYENFVKNVKITEKIGEVALEWDLETTENTKGVIIDMKVGYIRRVVRVPSDKKEYTYKGAPLKEAVFTLIPVSNNEKRGKKIKVKGTPKLQDTLIRTDEYIDLSSDEVKLLFKTNYGNKINVLLGDTQENLKLVKTVEDYDFRTDRIILEGLKAGKTYFYQIEAINGEKKIISDVESLKKIEIGDIPKNKWAKESIFYEVFVRSFYDGNGDGIGDFKGLEEKLDYLKDLGVDALWLMPTLRSDTYHGYDIVDYYKVEDDYGTMDDFESLLDAAHKKGIKIIIDLVVNHSSDDIFWMEEAAKSKENFYRNYYVWEDEFSNLYEIGEWGQEVWSRNIQGDHYYALFWNKMPDLNFRNQYVREEMKNIASFWLDKGVDGFRLDAAKHIDDHDKDVTLAWWKQFASHVKKENPNAFLVGENWTSDIEFLSKFYESLDSSFNFKLSDGIVDMLQGKNFDPIEELNKDYKEFEKYSAEYIDTIFLRNHDMERLATTLKGDKKKLKLAANLLFTLPGTPFLYYGEELGQEGTKPDENIREPFDWYKDAKGEGMTSMEKGGFFGNMRFTKANDRISLEEQIDNPDSLYARYKKMIAIRKENPFMFTGIYEKIDTEEGIYSYKISGQGNLMIVLHNFSEEEKQISLQSENLNNFVELITGEELDTNKIKIEAYESKIIKYIK